MSTSMSTDAILANPPHLRVSNLEAAYGAVRAVRGVSLMVPRESVVTVLGSNGAGKSTILRAISGTLEPVRGQIQFGDQTITGFDPANVVRTGLCHVPEGREVFPLLSVGDNLLMGGYTQNDRDKQARTLEAIYGFFPILKERLHQPAGLLSGGQQQMLAISRALMCKMRRWANGPGNLLPNIIRSPAFMRCTAIMRFTVWQRSLKRQALT